MQRRDSVLFRCRAIGLNGDVRQRPVSSHAPLAIIEVRLTIDSLNDVPDEEITQPDGGKDQQPEPDDKLRLAKDRLTGQLLQRSMQGGHAARGVVVS
jgi:hypothetical protein